MSDGKKRAYEDAQEEAYSQALKELASIKPPELYELAENIYTNVRRLAVDGNLALTITQRKLLDAAFSDAKKLRYGGVRND